LEGSANVTFQENVGQISGGAVYVNFQVARDQAVYGEAISVSELSYSGFEPGVEVYLEDLLVINNMKFQATELSSTIQTGIVDISFLNVFLKGSNTFSRNQDTAMSLYGAIVTISDNTLFEHNVGLMGGAMHLESESYLVLEGSANVTFQENVGQISGGAVYVNFQVARATNPYDCFLFFDEINQNCNLFAACNITDVNASLQFINNSSPLGSAIYGSAFSTCPWGQGNLAYQPEPTPENGLKMIAFLNGLQPTIVFDPPMFPNPLPT